MTLEQYKEQIEGYLKRAELELASAQAKVNTYRAKLANADIAFKKSRYGKKANSTRIQPNSPKTEKENSAQIQVNSPRIQENSQQSTEKKPKSIYDDFGAMMLGEKK